MDEQKIKTEYQEAETKFSSRKVFGELNVLKSADGSALITDYSCQTQILAAIHGPGDVRETRQLHGQMAINVTFLKEQQPMYESAENDTEMASNNIISKNNTNNNLIEAFEVNEARQ